MEMSPNQVRTASFASARKGWDPSEVTAFLERAADALEAAQNHATAMEARARAAVSKLQEFSTAASTPAAEPERPPVDDQAETISRTLLLAQRAADEAVAEAKAEAERVVAEARVEARRADSEERDLVRSEVESLTARRDFLQSDVEQLENFLLDQRERLRSAATTLVQMAEQVPGGLGYIRPPLLSASDDDTPSSMSDWLVERDVAVRDAGDAGDAGDVDDDAPGGHADRAPDAAGTQEADTPASRSDDELRIDPLDVGDDAGERRGLHHADDATADDATADDATADDATADDARADDDTTGGTADDATAGGTADDDTTDGNADGERAAMPTIRIGGDHGAVPGSGPEAGDDDPTPEGLPLRFTRGGDDGPRGGGPADRTGGSGR